MSVTDAAWLAGFFDGEGSLVCYEVPRSKAAWRLQVVNTVYGSLEKCQTITGTGTLTEKNNKNQKNRKRKWYWCVNSQRDIAAIVKQLRPFLVVKHIVSDKFLANWKDI